MEKMKYSLQDFENMTYTKRKRGYRGTNPNIKLRVYKGKHYLTLNKTLIEELNIHTDLKGKANLAVANFPEKHIQIVFNPVSKNIQTEKIKVNGGMKFTNTELTNKFLEENNKTNSLEDLDLDWDISFKRGKMIALECKLK